jgi:sigma-E factor negative regulatory protein RseA
MSSDEHRNESLNERESQLSAMFDGELPGAECELLARRLTRDEALRAQWSRYSMIGAALRAERGVALHDRVAWRVQSIVAQEVTYGDGAAIDVAAATGTRRVAVSADDVAKRSFRWMRFARPVVGASIAAGVAALSIFWLRTQDAPAELLASNPVSESIVLTPDTTGTTVAMNPVPPAAREPVSNGEPDRYVTPAPSAQTSIAPPARLANYVVAHSEYSGPLSRRMALLGLVATDNAGEAALPAEGAQVPGDAAASNVEATDAR